MKQEPSISKRIRVLCVIETLGRGGGAEQLVVSLAPELKKQGVDLEFLDLFSWPDDLGVELERMGFTVHRARLSHRWALLHGAMSIRRVVKESHFDVIWSHLYFANIYAQAFNLLNKYFHDVKTISTLHSTANATPEGGLLAHVKSWVERWLLKQADVRVGVSHSVSNAYHDNAGLHGVKVIYNAVNTSVIPHNLESAEKENVRIKFGVGKEDFLIVVPARFVYEKGHSYLLKAIASINNTERRIRAVFLGSEGSLRDSILELRNELGLHSIVTLQGIVPQPDLHKLLAASDCVVLPSLREAFGLAAAEAMVTATPVILTSVDGFIELVGDSECALIVQPANYIELADAILKIMTDPIFAMQLGIKGRQRVVENFDISICALAWRELFVQTIYE